MTQMTAVIQQLQKERARAAREVSQLDAALAALNGAARKAQWDKNTFRRSKEQNSYRAKGAMGEGESGGE